MNVIIPLAGPDIYTRFNSPTKTTKGTSFLESILSKRNWSRNLNNTIIFILRKENDEEITLIKIIKKNFPKSKIIVLDYITKGALFTSVLGVTQIENLLEPVIVDLADIDFYSNIEIESIFSQNVNIRAIVPYFYSLESKYSYMKLDNGFVSEVVEKKVISNNASAGVYIFRNLFDFLDCFSFALQYPSKCSVNGIYYICPSLESLILKNLLVFPVEVILNNELQIEI
jgi:hypothetical protein